MKCLFAALQLIFLHCILCDDVSLWRLPNTTIPIEYNVLVNVSSTSQYKFAEVFTGTTEIRMKVLNSTNEIFLNSKLSNISNVILKDSDGNEILVNYHLISDREFVQIKVVNETLLEGDSEYTVLLYYNSTLRTDKLGVHLTSYVDGDGRRVEIIATQFAPTEARHAFPCFDEPRFKARFFISIVYPKEYHVLGNMDVAKGPEDIGNQLITSFEPTPLISSYLVSFIVSNFPHTTVKRTKFTQELYVRDNSKNLTEDGEMFAADVLQQFVTIWTSAPLPITTMKQVAVPNFYFGGMENLGSVFYNEDRWFYSSKVNSIKKLLRLKTVLAHEMSHQWFGDLVTMDWWTHVWLNEGFATLMGYYGTQMIDPDSNIMQIYQAKVMMNALMADEDEGVRAMSQYVEEPTLIMQHYDKIAYDKASCVIRMFEHAIGKNEFKTGLDFYLGNMSYKNAHEDHLFKYLQKGVEFHRKPDFDFDVGKEMKVWTAQSGVPIINVTVDKDNHRVDISQERFIVKYPMKLWPIPVTYVTSSNASSTIFWLRKQKYSFHSKDHFNWILFNVNQTGYYRVNYDEESWRVLANSLKKDYKQFSWENRAQLVNDAFDMARVNYLSNFSVVLDLIHFYRDETEYSPWAIFDYHVNIIKSRLSGLKIHKNFENFMKFVLLHQYERVLPKKFKRPMEKLARKLILKNACELRKCSLDENDVDLRSEYYCDLLKQDHTKIVFDKINEEKNKEVRDEMFQSFGCGTRDFLRKVLRETVNPNTTLSLAEQKTIYEAIYKKSSDDFDTFINFLLENLEDVFKIHESKSVNGLAVDASKYANSEDNQQKLLLLVKNEQIFTSESRKLIKKNIEMTKQWFSWHLNNIDEYLQQYSHGNVFKVSLTLLACSAILNRLYIFNVILN